MSLLEPGGIDCDIHPAVPNIRALHPYLSDHWRDIVVQRGVHELEFDRLSGQLAAHLAPRLAAAERQARLRPRRAARPRTDAVRHLNRHLQLPLRRAAAVLRGHGCRLRPRGERLDGSRVAGQGTAAARLDRGADAERRTGGGGDQPRRARQALRADPAAGDARPPAGQAPLLADLRRGREARPAGRHPRRLRLSPPGHAAGLANILHRGLRRAGAGVPGRAVVAGLRGCVHQIPRAEGRAAGVRGSPGCRRICGG